MINAYKKFWPDEANALIDSSIIPHDPVILSRLRRRGQKPKASIRIKTMLNKYAKNVFVTDTESNQQ